MLDTNLETRTTYEPEETKDKISFLKKTKKYILKSLEFIGENRDDQFPEVRNISIDAIPYLPLD